MSHMWHSENMELILEKKTHISIIQRMKLSKYLYSGADIVSLCIWPKSKMKY